MSEVERHPFEPFLPVGCKMLMLGSFPPAPKRWCMEFYYPNFTNDMWRILGYIFFKDKNYFVDKARKTFRLEQLKSFLEHVGIGLYDTASAVIRTTGTAADKDLEVVEPTDVAGLLRRVPSCQALVTTGQLATDVLTSRFHLVRQPQVGSYVPFIFEEDGREMRLYRMPSSSRAYPMKVERKSDIYEKMFKEMMGGTENFNDLSTYLLE